MIKVTVKTLQVKPHRVQILIGRDQPDSGTARLPGDADDLRNQPRPDAGAFTETVQ